MGNFGMDTILTLAIVAVLIAIVVKLVRALILRTSQNSADGFQAAPKELAALAGQSGQSLSPLRPAGVALIDGQRVDVVTDGEFIEPETEVEVVAVEGSRVVVRSL
jgi:membrane-bound serine protease (ClpP class)